MFPVDERTGKEQPWEPVVSLGFHEIVLNVVQWLTRADHKVGYEILHEDNYDAVVLKRHGFYESEKSVTSEVIRIAKLIRFKDGNWRIRFTIWLDVHTECEGHPKGMFLKDVLDLEYNPAALWGQTQMQRAYMNVVNHLNGSMRFDNFRLLPTQEPSIEQDVIMHSPQTYVRAHRLPPNH